MQFITYSWFRKKSLGISQEINFAVEAILKVLWNLISRLSNILQGFLCKKSNFSIAFSDILEYNTIIQNEKIIISRFAKVSSAKFSSLKVSQNISPITILQIISFFCPIILLFEVLMTDRPSRPATSIFGKKEYARNQKFVTK